MIFNGGRSDRDPAGGRLRAGINRETGACLPSDVSRWFKNTNKKNQTMAASEEARTEFKSTSGPAGACDGTACRVWIGRCEVGRSLSTDRETRGEYKAVTLNYTEWVGNGAGGNSCQDLASECWECRSSLINSLGKGCSRRGNSDRAWLRSS